jgi:predicted dehydrogenase
MDGVMFMHSGRLQRMSEALKDGRTVGGIRRISSAFSFRGDEEFFASNVRVQSQLEPYGCLGDLGWYCIRFSLWAMNWMMPKRITADAVGIHSPEQQVPGADGVFSGILFRE